MNSNIIGSKSRPKGRVANQPGTLMDEFPSSSRIDRCIKLQLTVCVHTVLCTVVQYSGILQKGMVSDHMHPQPPLCQGSQTMVPPRLICHEPALEGE